MLFFKSREGCKGEGMGKEKVGYAAYDIVLNGSAYLFFFSPQVSKQSA